MVNRHSWKGLVLSGLAVAVLGTAQAQVSGGGNTLSLDEQIQDKLGLYSWTLQEVDPPVIPPDGGFDSYVDLGGKVVHLDLHPYSMRSSNFRVEEVDAFGNRTAVPTPKSCTYRGDARDPETGEVLGSVVATCDEGKLWTRVRFANDDGNVWALQPLSDVIVGDSSTTHVTYYSEDIIPFPGQCGTDNLPDISNRKKSKSLDGDNGTGGGFEDAGDDIIEVAFECDWPYTNWAWGGQGKKIQRTVRSTENVMLDCEEIYERDCGVTFIMTYYSIRNSASKDPYSGSNASSLLSQFQSIWNTTFSDVDRTIAHFMSGRNTGGILGIAYVDVLCDATFGYGFSWTTFTTNSVSRAGLTAHEIGHQASAPHCDGDGDCRIMCSGLGGCSGNLTAFGNRAINAITSGAGGAGCVKTEGSTPVPPVFDDFESGSTLDPNIWHYVWGGRSGTGGVGEPSGVRSMRLNTTGADKWDADDVRTGDMDLSAFSNVTLSFYIEQRGMEVGEKTKITRYNAGKNWRPLHEEISDGIDDATYKFVSVAVPSNGIHSRSKFRFRQRLVQEADDNAYIDDVSITASAFTVWSGLSKAHLDGSRSGNFRVFGSPPDAPMVFFASLEGLKKRPFDPNSEGLDLLGQVLRLGSTESDLQGLAELILKVPAGTPSLSFYVQAVIQTATGYEKSQPVLVTINP